MSQMRRGLKKNATENEYVFKCSLKAVSDSPVTRRLNGSSFQVRGPAAAKDRSPKVLFWRGTWQTRRSVDRGAGVSIRKVQPADNRQQGNPAPGPTVHGKRDSLLDPLPNRSSDVAESTEVVYE